MVAQILVMQLHTLSYIELLPGQSRPGHVSEAQSRKMSSFSSAPILGDARFVAFSQPSQAGSQGGAIMKLNGCDEIYRWSTDPDGHLLMYVSCRPNGV